MTAPRDRTSRAPVSAPGQPRVPGPVPDRGLPASTTESELQQLVVDLARVTGWRTNHTRRSRGKGGRWVTATSCVGMPDLTLWNPRHGGLLFVELKTERGKLSAEQAEVIASLRAAGCDARVWRPSSWPEVVEALTGRVAAG